jgi:hypothetical protein
MHILYDVHSSYYYYYYHYYYYYLGLLTIIILLPCKEKSNVVVRPENRFLKTKNPAISTVTKCL